MTLLIFNSREWQKQFDHRMQWLEFLSQHRKYGYKVILAAQADKMIDNQFRMLIEYEVKHRKLGKFGVWGAILSRLFFGRGYVQLTYYYQMSDCLQRDWYWGSKKDFAMYDTRKTFDRNA